MKSTERIMIMAVALSAAMIFSASATPKDRKKAEVLDGTAVSIGQSGPSTPVEKKLSQVSRPALEYAPAKTIYLYPKGQDADQGIVENGVTVTLGPGESTGLKEAEAPMGTGFMTNVSDSARIDIYLPKNANGQMVVAAPGGGYSCLSSWIEGQFVAKWLNDRGIACAVLKYRMPHGHAKAPLRDMQNAMRYCRYHAQDWGVKQIGVAGFSAGGHLAASAQTMYADSLTKPDFAILFYPVISTAKGITDQSTIDNLLGKAEDWSSRDNYSFDEWYARQKEYKALLEEYSLEDKVTPSTCPAYIAVSSDDKILNVMNSIRFYRSLVKAKVYSEMHVFPMGNHGYGLTDPQAGIDTSAVGDYLGICRPELTQSLTRWLEQQRERFAGEKAAESVKKETFSLNPTKTVLLYPEGQNVDKGIVEDGEAITLGPGVSTGSTRAETFGKDLNLRYTSDSARFDLYLADNPNGKFVVICPGGAYWFTAVMTEGAYAAEWLNSIGISAAVVKYRIPYGRCTAPLTDVQNTFRYVRHHAAEWGITQVGVMGFSAGGHLAASASNLYSDPVTRPDFSVLVYPVISSEPGVTHQDSMNNLIGSKAGWNRRKDAAADGCESSFDAWTANKEKYESLLEKYSMDRQVSSDTPRTFLISSANDWGVPPENELRYFTALKQNGVPCEMHFLPGGVHGYGFNISKYGKDPIGPYRADFLRSMQRFLENL